jgi:hypothetical protein
VNEYCARFPFFRSLENRDLRNEAAIYTAVKQISLRRHHSLESVKSNANDDFPTLLD